MSFITGKHLARRTFLRGLGATVALPFLDAMVPAGRVFAKAPGAERTRLVCIEEVHGLAGCNTWGASKYLFAPEAVGRDFKLVPDNPLTTLEAYRDYMTIVSNTDVRMAEAFDQPTIRAIAKTAEANDYKMSSFILGVVKSDAFRLRRAEPAATETAAAVASK